MNNTFKAAVLFKQKQNPPLKICELLHQDPIGSEVKVKMITSGLCGAQVNEISGLKGEDKYLPHLMGHEGYGQVVSVGNEVTKVQPQDYVILHWRVASGLGLPGIKFKEINGGSIGAGPITTFSEYSTIAENRCTKVPDNEDLQNVLPLLGCALPTAYGAMIKEAKISIDEDILIFGAGGLGMALLFWANVFGVKNVTVVDIHNDKKNQIEELGGRFLHASEVPHINSGFDVIFDTTGIASNISSSLDIANKSARIILIGQSKVGESVIFNNFLKIYDGIKIIPSEGGLFDPDEDMQNLYDMVLKNIILAKKLISNVISLDQVNEGFELMKNSDARRVIIDFNAD